MGMSVDLPLPALLSHKLRGGYENEVRVGGIQRLSQNDAEKRATNLGWTNLYRRGGPRKYLLI